jgi:trigger factor
VDNKKKIEKNTPSETINPLDPIKQENAKTPPVNQPPEPSSQELGNDRLKIKIYFQKNCKVELLIEASPLVVTEAKQKAAKSVRKEVSIAGFRKGKAPLNLIEARYAKQIHGELEKTLAIEVFQEAKSLINIPLLNNEPKIGYNVKSITTEGAVVIVSFETEPSIPFVDFEKITLTKVPRPPVNNETIDETIRQFQFFSAEWKSVEGRGVEEGDFVTLDVDITEEPPPTRLFSNVRFEVTDRYMAPWMKRLVLQHHTGESIEGISEVEEQAPIADKEKFSPKKVLITIKKIETTNLPEINDNFAQTIGKASVESLKASVESFLNKKADAYVQEKLREQVAEYLLKNYSFEIPLSLVEKEVRFRLEYFTKDPEYAQNWQKMTSEARKHTVASIAEQSNKALLLFYLCKHILSEAKIPISSKEVKEDLHDPLEAVIGEPKHTKTSKEEAFSQHLLEKTEDFIISKAKIIE